METKIPSGQSTLLSKGKSLKRFLDKDDVLSLAASIADAQEKKVQSRTDRNHELLIAQPRKTPKTMSKTKIKLKEKKAILLVARRAQAKRKKARSRQQHSQGDDQNGPGNGKPMNTACKKVSFL